MSYLHDPVDDKEAFPWQLSVYAKLSDGNNYAASQYYLDAADEPEMRSILVKAMERREIRIREAA